MNDLLGTHILIVRAGLVIECEILEVRSPRAHGARPEIRITPVAGHGRAWVTDWQHLPSNSGLVEGPTHGKK